MERQLKEVQHEFYEPMVLQPFYSETMRESIVPDSCPDIARIVDTSAVLCLTGREVTGDQRFSASGTVDVTVLYIPEKGSGPCALHFQMPFQCYGDGAAEGSCCFPDLRGELQNIDTRLLNPRKVLTRANLALYPSGCDKISLSLCTEPLEQDNGIQLLHQKKECRVIAGVKEKEFTVMEELPLSPGRVGIGEILTTRVDIRGADSKLIGNKLVVKGLIAVTVMYRDEDGVTALLCQELPFSQIMDGSGLEEDWESDTCCCIIGADCRMGTADGTPDARLITLTLQMRARASVWRREDVCFLADAYSVADALECRMQEVELRENSRSQCHRISVREMLETGVAVKSIVDTYLSCGEPKFSADRKTVEVTMRGKCLHWDENDMLRCVSKEFVVTVPAEIPAEAAMESACVQAGEIISNILPDGIELRFPLDLTLRLSQCGRNLCVSGLDSAEQTEHEEPRPSVVLRKISSDESLWSVAKEYRTTCRAIMNANGIAEDGQVPTDRLLLIPRSRG